MPKAENPLRDIIDSLEATRDNINIHVVGYVPTEDQEESYYFRALFSELVKNCLVNRLQVYTDPGKEYWIGAENVWVTFFEGAVVVEDDYSYEDPEKIVQRLNEISASGEAGHTTSPIDPSDGTHFSLGAGIFSVNFNFEKYGGGLIYYVN